MTTRIVIILFFYTQFSFGQIAFNKFSVTPSFGLGLYLPSQQTINEGSQKMPYNWKIYQFGKYFTADGTPQYLIKSTNKLSVDLGYDISEKLSLHIGGNRTNLVISYKPPFTYSKDNYEVASLDGSTDYLNMMAGFKYKLENSYFKVDFQYTPNIFKRYLVKEQDFDPNIDFLDHRNNYGTGVLYELVDFSKKIPSLYLALGEEISFLGEDTNIEIGLNLGFRPFESQKTHYFQNGIETGSSTTKYGTNAIFISLNKPIYFKKKEKVIKKEEPEIPKKQQVILGKKTFSTGENLVLDNINFEQTKAVLDPFGMKELDLVFDLLVRYPNSIIELTGHTSNEGNRNENIELSKRRAEACKSYLVRKGIKPNRIKAYGVGPDRPISTTEKEINRRVEVKVISVN